MPQPVDQPGAVPGPALQHPAQVVPHRRLVGGVVHGRQDLLHLPGHAAVGAAVLVPFQRPDGPGDGRIAVRPGGGDHPAGEGGAVGRVVGVQHQAQIQQVHLLLGRPFPLGEGQDRRGGAQSRRLRQEGGGQHDPRHRRNQIKALPQQVHRRQRVGIVVPVVHCQHRPGHAVHAVGGGAGVQPLGQRPPPGDRLAELPELLVGGQPPQQQQPAGLLKQGAGAGMAGQLLDVDPPVEQPSGYGFDGAVRPLSRAHHLGYPGHPGQYAGAVGVAQAALDPFHLLRRRPESAAVQVLVGESLHRLPQGGMGRDRCHRKTAPFHSLWLDKIDAAIVAENCATVKAPPREIFV